MSGVPPPSSPRVGTKPPLLQTDAPRTNTARPVQPAKRHDPPPEVERGGKIAAKDVAGLTSPRVVAKAPVTFEEAEAAVATVLTSLPQEAHILTKTAARYLELLPREPDALISALAQIRSSPANEIAAQALFDRILTPQLDAPLRDLEAALRSKGADSTPIRALRHALKHGELVSRADGPKGDLRADAAWNAMADAIERFVTLRDTPLRLPPINGIEPATRRKTCLDRLEGEIDRMRNGAAVQAGVEAGLSLSFAMPPSLRAQYALHDFAQDGFSPEDAATVKRMLASADLMIAQMYFAGGALGLGLTVAGAINPSPKHVYAAAQRHVVPFDTELASIERRISALKTGVAETSTEAKVAAVEGQALSHLDAAADALIRTSVTHIERHQALSAVLFDLETKGRVKNVGSLMKKLHSHDASTAVGAERFADIVAEMEAAKLEADRLAPGTYLDLDGEALAPTRADGTKASSFDFAVRDERTAKVLELIEVKRPEAPFTGPYGIKDAIGHVLEKLPETDAFEGRIRGIIVQHQSFPHVWRTRGQIHTLARDGTYTQQATNGRLLRTENFWETTRANLSTEAKLSRIEIVDSQGQLIVGFARKEKEWFIQR